jgi:hypothetical protein
MVASLKSVFREAPSKIVQFKAVCADIEISSAARNYAMETWLKAVK